MNRRVFIQTSTSAAAMLSCFPAGFAGISCQRKPGLLEKRSLGRTGEYLSVLGFGGIVVKDATPEQASQRVREAIDAGVNYFDVAPSYGDAEVKLGPALEPFRKDVFLACKTMERSKEGAQRELDQSLKHLRTDHFDLYQFHAVTTLEEVDAIFGPEGAMETFAKGREAGTVRFIGFSAHSVEAAMALMDRFDFDTILFPVNFATWHAGNFGPQVLERARMKNMGILALKAMARGPLPRDTENPFTKCWYEPLSKPEDALMGLRFTLSHPVTAAVPPGDENLYRMALGLADRFKPLQPSEVEVIKEKALAGQPLFRYPQS